MVSIIQERTRTDFIISINDDTDEVNITGKAKEEYDLQIKRKNAVDEHRKPAKGNKSIVCANFDLEAVLICPVFFGTHVFLQSQTCCV